MGLVRASTSFAGLGVAAAKPIIASYGWFAYLFAVALFLVLFVLQRNLAQRMEIAAEIRREQRQRQWKAGDTANSWEAELGEDFWNLYANEFGYSYPSLRNCQRVCEAIPPPYRNERLSYSHHVVIYEKNREDMEAWLDRAETEEWTVREFREAVNGPKPKIARWTYAQLEEHLCDACRGRVLVAMGAE